MLTLVTPVQGSGISKDLWDGVQWIRNSQTGTSDVLYFGYYTTTKKSLLTFTKSSVYRVEANDFVLLVEQPLSNSLPVLWITNTADIMERLSFFSFRKLFFPELPLEKYSRAICSFNTIIVDGDNLSPIAARYVQSTVNSLVDNGWYTAVFSRPSVIILQKTSKEGNCSVV